MMPLSGLVVLDLTRLTPGGFCTLMLADYGARVIKIEDTEMGDYIRLFPPYYHKTGANHWICNRNKESLSIDLKTQTGKDIFKQLVKKADVVLDSFRPGAMDRLGLGYETLKSWNDRIICCSITGFGQTGPYKHRVGHDTNYIALTGLLDLNGEKNGRPIIPSTQIADIGGGSLNATIAILMALYAREKSGHGDYIDISMLDGTIPWLTLFAGDYFAEGKPAVRGESPISGDWPRNYVYKTKDNKYMAVSATEDKFWARLLKILALPDVDKSMDLTDEKTKNHVRRRLEEEFAKKTRQEWEDFLKNEEVCVSPVLNIEEAFKNEQVVSREMFIDVEFPGYGKAHQMGLPLKMKNNKGSIRTAPPRHGEHTRSILKEIGFQDTEIDGFVKEKIVLCNPK